MSGHHDEDDLIRAAQRQMAKHYLELFSDLTAKVHRKLGLEASKKEIYAAIEQVLAEDPEAQALAERLATFGRWQSQREGGE